MPRLNQNQRMQAFTMLIRCDYVPNISRVFGCHRNTIIRLRQRFQQTGGLTDGRRPGRRRVTNPRTGRFIMLTHLHADAPSTSFSNDDKFCKAVRYQQTDRLAPPQASPATHSAKEALSGTSAYSTSSGCLFAVGTTAFPLGGDSSGLGFYSLMSLGLTLVIMRVEFEFLEEEGDVLLIIVSLRGTILEVGVLWYGGGITGRRKTNLIVVQGNLNAQVYINQILQPEAVRFLQRPGPAILMHDNAKPHVARTC